MRKIINFIVEKRYIVLAIMLAFTALMACFAPHIEINYDMTKYLADNSNMKQGLDILNKNFEEVASQQQSIRIMLKDLDEDTKKEVSEKLSNLDKVGMVMPPQDKKDEDDGHVYTLFTIMTSAKYQTDEIREIESQLTTMSEEYVEYGMCFFSDDPNFEIPMWIMALAVSAVIIILFLTCASWFEPLLLLAVIGLAILANYGSNIIIGSVSSITASISAILQLALSIDYSIILINRYRQERERVNNTKIAMKMALTGSISSVASSSFTTVVGLLALILMNFKIGANLGIVLAKGVFISLVYVLTIMPCLIILFDKAILKTTKSTLLKNHIDKLDEKKKKLIAKLKNHKNFSTVMSNVTFKWRSVILILFVALFVSLSFFQNKTTKTFSLEKPDEIKNHFAPSNMVIMLYTPDEENDFTAENSENVAKYIAAGAGVESDYTKNTFVINSYQLTCHPYNNESIAEEFANLTQSLMGIGLNLPQKIINTVYFNKGINDKEENFTEDETLEADEFYKFLSEFLSDIATSLENGEIEKYIDESDFLSEINKVQMIKDIWGEVKTTTDLQNFLNFASKLLYKFSLKDEILTDEKTKEEVVEFFTKSKNEDIKKKDGSYLITKEQLASPLIPNNFTIQKLINLSTIGGNFFPEDLKIYKPYLPIAKDFIDALEKGSHTKTELLRSFESLNNIFKEQLNTQDDIISENLVNLMWKAYFANVSASTDKLNNEMTIAEFAENTITLLNDCNLLNKNQANDMKEKIGMINQLKSTDENGKDIYLLIFQNTLPQEGKETFEFYDNLEKSCKENFGEGNYYIVGNSFMNYEMSNEFPKELALITIATILIIFLVVAITFKNIAIPLILVSIVQCGVYLTVCVCSLFSGVYFLGLLMVECILMGATIDYGILFTNYYRENRQYTSVKKSIKNSYKHSIHTVMTSGLILIIATGLIGIFDHGIISQICIAISVGALSAVLLILFALPSLLIVFDKWVMGKKLRQKAAEYAASSAGETVDINNVIDDIGKLGTKADSDDNAKQTQIESEICENTDHESNKEDNKTDNNESSSQDENKK